MRQVDVMPTVGSRFAKSSRTRPPAKLPARAYTRTDKWARAENLYQHLAAAFERLGAWISTHQTLSLLATALVICSLLSPAILVTFSPSGSFLDVSTSAITRRGRGEFVWELEGMARQGLISTEEEVCWDRVRNYYAKTGREGGGTRIRVEQILVPVGAVGTSTTSRATISKAALHRIWRVQEEVERRLLSGEIPGNTCIRSGAGCAVLSPTGWWTDEAALLRDDDVHRTLSTPPPVRPNLTLPLTLSDTFVGIGRDRQGTIKTAQQIILTFLLESAPIPDAQDPDDDALRAATAAWRSAVHDVVGNRGWHASWPSSTGNDPIAIASDSKVPTRHVVLKYLPRLTVEAHPRLLENTIYGAGYALVLVYVSRFVRKLRAHSKLGLLATGAVELVASGIMSVSICWLLGWGLSLVPWNLLAFLVLTSGLDNMILVLRAISDTDVNLPVPRRMSQGLRTVGAEMTILLVVEELLALGLLWWVEITVMREWIRFGAIVLVVDYFLELTFFSTVLSIDIQRLELADLLAQNSATPYKPQPESSAVSGHPRDTSRGYTPGTIARSTWKVLRDRPAKTSTVAFLWTINTFLWTSYGSEHYLPAACSQTALSPDRPFLAPALSPSVSRSLRLGQGADSASSSYSEVMAGAAEAFWGLVNPKNSTSVQVYLEPPISIQFLDDGALAAPESLEALLPHEHTTSMFVKVGVVLLPIAVVMGLLYVLLIFLLKDAELLQAHWGSEERLGGASRDRRRPSALKRPPAGIEAMAGKDGVLRHDHDVELVASGGDILVTWGALDTRLRVSRLLDGSFQLAYDVQFDTSAAVPTLSRIVLDSSAVYCAVLSVDGKILIWRLAEEEATPVHFAGAEGVSSSATSLVAACGVGSPSSRLSTDSQDVPPIATSAPPEPEPLFYSLHKDGSLYQWSASSETYTCRRYSAAAACHWLVPTRSGIPVSVAVDKGNALHVQPLDQVSPGPTMDVPTSAARITALSSVRPAEPSQQDPFFAVGRSSGVLELYRGGESRAVASIDGFEGSIRKISLRPQVVDSTCSSCGSLLGRACLVAASTRDILKVFQVFTPPEDADNECLCRPDASGRTAPSSPTISRVSSMSTPSRRFSPRKKASTPTRPNAPSFAIADTSLRPPMPPTRSSSSSGSSSPERERDRMTNGVSSPAAPPPRSKPVSPHASPPPQSARLPDTRPLAGFPPFGLEQLEPGPKVLGAALANSSVLHHVEVASVGIDERGGGWVMLEDRIVGLRRVTESAHDMAGTRGWEVWSLALGLLAGGPLDAGVLETASRLEDVIGSPLGVATRPTSNGYPAAEVSDATALVPTTGLSQSALRRRRPSLLPPNESKSDSAAPLPPFLPFSRVRPIVPALNGTAAAVGLGNRVVVLRPTSHKPALAVRDHRNGFLGI
ncbi:hypothetical protein JCM3774_006841 [Rhodotorula dairenensis]